MPLTGREIVTSRSYTGSSQSTTAQRVWKTECTSRAEASNWLVSQAIKLGDAHPDLSGVFLDSLTFTPDADGTYTITGNYSAAGLFVFEQVNKQNRDPAKYVRWNFTTYDYSIDVPYAIRVALNVPGNPTKYVWTPQSQKVFKCDVLLSIEVRPNKLNLADVALIARETHRVHRFPSDTSNDWLFMGGNIRNASNTEDLVTYTWQRDAGDFAWVASSAPTLNPNQNTYNDLKDASNQPTVRFPDVTRPQHSRWIMRQNENPTNAPVFGAMFPYSINATGYSTLPGMNGLVGL